MRYEYGEGQALALRVLLGRFDVASAVQGFQSCGGVIIATDSLACRRDAASAR